MAKAAEIAMSGFDLAAFWQSETQEHLALATKTFASLEAPFQDLVRRAAECVRSGGKLIFFGNGGSAADAQHIATELTIRYISDRKPIAALSLTTDTSALTAAGNDYGFDHIFSRQLEALGKPQDFAIGLSTSGNSPNVLKALETARALGMTTAGLSGRDGGKMPALCDVMLIVPSPSTARIQEMHITLGHLLCGALEQELGLL
jgi:D-sedoheptulose 7-phosphate isomerase